MLYLIVQVHALLASLRDRVNRFRRSFTLEGVTRFVLYGTVTVLAVEAVNDYVQGVGFQAPLRLVLFVALVVFVDSASAELDELDAQLGTPPLLRWSLRSIVVLVATCGEIFVFRPENAFGYVPPLLLLLAEVLVLWVRLEPLRRAVPAPGTTSAAFHGLVPWSSRRFQNVCVPPQALPALCRSGPPLRWGTLLAG